MENLDCLYLRRKRLIAINGEDDEKYGENEQDSFTLVYSPDRLDTQYPLSQYNIRLSKTEKAAVELGKYEYFEVSRLIESLNRIIVRRYASFTELTDAIEEPIEDFLRTLHNWKTYNLN